MKSWYSNNSFSDSLGEAVRVGVEAVPEVGDFAEELYRLEGIPTAYLVSRTQMLPEESLRVFYIDENWIRCLVDGAFSVGRTSSLDVQHDALLRRSLFETVNLDHGVRTGFLLRSMLVQGWQGLQVSCYGQSSRGEVLLECQRLTQIGKDILWGVADGVISRVELTEPKENVGFGFVCSEEGKYVLPVSKLPQPEEDRTVCISRQACDDSQNVDVPFRQGTAEGVVDIAKLRDGVAAVLEMSAEEREKISALEMAAELLNTPLKYSVKGDLL